MRMKTIGWMVGIAGLVTSVGRAQAQGEAPPEVTGRDFVNEVAQKTECRDAGITVSFATGSAELDQNARGGLDGMATWLKADPARTLHLRGYADPTGTTEENLKLSERRADSVKAYLVAQGVDSTRILTAGRGEALGGQLPADGRTVTFLACQPPGATASNTGAEAPVEAVPPAAEPAPVYMPGGSTFGWALMAGGGYEDFSNADMQSRTNAGGAWDARLVGGLRSIAAFEAAYVGAAHGVQTLGATANNPSLVSNGLEGTFRLNMPIMKAVSLIEPYAFVGLGWSHYSISNFNSNTGVLSDFTSSADNVMTVPVGGGLAYGYKALLIDVRASYVPTYYNNYLQNTSGSGTLNHWGVGGQVGLAF